MGSRVLVGTLGEDGGIDICSEIGCKMVFVCAFSSEENLFPSHGFSKVSHDLKTVKN